MFLVFGWGGSGEILGSPSISPGFGVSCCGSDSCSHECETDRNPVRRWPVNSASRRYGERPHGGWRGSLESVPGSVGLIPRSARWGSSRGRFAVKEMGAVKAQGGRASAQRLSWFTSEGEKVRRVSASQCGKAHRECTDSQSEQNSEVEGPRPLRDCDG